MAVALGRGAFSVSATETDIRYCFRLLLGRNPNPEELRGHMMQVGEDLSGIVTSFLGSLEFSNRRLLKNDLTRTATVDDVEDFRIYSSPEDIAVGKHVRGGSYEPDVTAVFRRFVRNGMTVVDVGANIGYFTMLSARLVGPSGHVTAVEPNRRNAQLLEASRRANGFDNISVLQMAAGRDVGLLSLHTSHSNGTTSGLGGDIQAVLDAETVPCVPLDLFLGSLTSVDFIKIDVEGAEYGALLGCIGTIRRHRPIIVSEFSPDLMPGISSITGEDYLLWLMGLGYDIAIIEQDGALTQAGSDVRRVMQCYADRGTDHIDIVAMPKVP